jgi:Fic family protein
VTERSAGRDVEVIWNGRRVRAFVPTLLAQRDLTLSSSSIAKVATAQTDTEFAAESLGSEYEVLARLLLRSEGVASSFIEGITAPVIDVVLAEQSLPSPNSQAAWVSANLDAVTSALQNAANSELTTETLKEWHATLMAGSPTPERYVGVFRTEQGWIGGHDPTDAHLVTPPPGAIDGLLSDLIAYVRRTDVDPIAQAAIAHAQFEVIHPFADGNGRVGRVLIAWILARRLSLLSPPPVSVAIASDVGGYSSGLTLFRLGDLDAWVQWFAEAIRRAARSQRQLVVALEGLKVHWSEQLSGQKTLRSDATARLALDLIPRYIALTSDVVARELRVSTKVALDALRQLEERGVLLEYGTLRRGRGQPSKLYVSRELLALAGSTPLR